MVRLESLLLSLLTAAMTVVTAVTAGPVCPPTTDCKNVDDKQFEVKKTTVDFEYASNEIKIKCYNRLLAIDDPAMPRWPFHIKVPKASIEGCRLPKTSFFSTLAKLNITAKDFLGISGLPEEPALARVHLEGLTINNLQVSAESYNKPLKAEDNALSAIPGLRVLLLSAVTLSPNAALRLPNQLEKLTLKYAINGEYLKGMLERLKKLQMLMLEEEDDLIRNAPSLDGLTQLRVVDLSMTLKAPPAYWLPNTTLESVTLNFCDLNNLNEDMFEDASVKKLYLRSNGLTTLHPKLLLPLQKSLRVLDLVDNKLQVSKSMAEALEPLQMLEKLDLSRNPNLESLCYFTKDGDAKSRSPLPNNLIDLDLTRTSARKICVDWVNGKLPRLQNIVLENNQIETLHYEDLKMMRHQDVDDDGKLLPETTRPTVNINLKENPITVELHAADFEECLQAAKKPESLENLRRAVVYLELTSVPCDCKSYWLAKALKECSLLRAKEPPACSSHPESEQNLLNVHLSDLLCKLEPTDCVTGCDCAYRSHGDVTVVNCSAGFPLERLEEVFAETRLVLWAAPGALNRLPALRNLVELHAPRNDISELPDTLPSTLQILDLRYNQLSHLSTAVKVPELKLAGNPIDECSCDIWRTLRVLHENNQVTDYKKLRCAEMTETEACPPTVWSISLAIVLFVVGLFVVPTVVVRAVLPMIKRALLLRGYCVSWVLGGVDDSAPGKKYDVFVSYAHQDSDFVFRTLLPGLEQRGYRPCVHDRDWNPGDCIADQIVKSVAASRRTLLVLTPYYATAKWTRAEFKVAHAAALRGNDTRVIVLLLEEVPPEGLDPDLRAFIANNTYLAWHKPSNPWRQLCGSLPSTPIDEQLQIAPETDCFCWNLCCRKWDCCRV